MSNVTFVVADALRKGRVDAWLAEHGCPSEEIVKRDLAGGWVLYIVAARAETYVRGRTFYRGTCVASHMHAMVLDADGWVTAPEEIRQDLAGHGGEYIAASWNRRRVRIARDIFGSVTLAYTQAPGVAVVSDSLLIIRSLRKHLGAPVTPNIEVLAARSVRSGHAGQQMSPDTQLREASVIPVGQTLTLRAGLGGVRLHIDGPTLTERLLDRPVDQVALTRELSVRIAGIVRATADASDIPPEIGLSGGYDSRLVLAGARASGRIEAFRVTSADSTPAHMPDFAVASEMSIRFDFALNARPTARERVQLPGSPLAVWGSTHLGIYDRLIPMHPKRSAGASVSLSGLGAEILKGNWGWTPIEDFTRGMPISDLQKSAFVNQVERALHVVGADPSWNDASEIFYLAHRNGVHGSGHIGVNMSQVRPLQMFDMARLGHSHKDGTARYGSPRGALIGSYDTIADMLSILDPELASHRFDTPEKALTAASIRARLERLGGPISPSEIPTFTVYGKFEEPGGASRLGIAISRGLGVDGAVETEHLLPMAQEFLSLVPAELTDIYSDLWGAAVWRLVDKKLPPTHAGFALPKILTLAVLT